MNFYPFHIGDYLSHTAHLTPIEDIAYRRMMDLYYLQEIPLPDDPQKIARLIRMSGHEQDVQTILSEFFELRPDGWIHERCDHEIAAMTDKRDKARASAAASVAARSAKAQRSYGDYSDEDERTLNERSTDAERPLSEGSATNTNTNTNTNTKEKNKNSPPPDGFDLFWSAYPKKEGKQDAIKVFTKLKPDQQLLEIILNAVTIWSYSDKWRNGYAHNPATWLRGKHWEDEPPKLNNPPALRKVPAPDNFDQITYGSGKL